MELANISKVNGMARRGAYHSQCCTRRPYVYRVELHSFNGDFCVIVYPATPVVYTALSKVSVSPYQGLLSTISNLPRQHFACAQIKEVSGSHNHCVVLDTQVWHADSRQQTDKGPR